MNGSKRPRPSPDDAPDTEAEVTQPSTSATTPRNTFLNLPLLPPSPPPANSSKDRYDSKGKGKSKAKPKATFSRKKAKVLEEATAGDDGAEDEDDSGEEPSVKIVERPWSRHNSAAAANQAAAGNDAEGDDSDDWLPHPPPIPASQTSPDADLETISVNLPESLHRILAFSPGEARKEARKERKVVTGLLYGRRGHYDPERGGEVWGVGEVDEESDGGGLEVGMGEGEATEEDEWEGEGVPWEVGEL